MGWRGLYLVGVLPLLLVAWLRRSLPETARFEQLDRPQAGVSLGDWMRPFAAILRAYPARFAAVGGVAFLWAASNSPVDFFLPKFRQEMHGWSPGKYAEVTIAALGFGVPVIVALVYPETSGRELEEISPEVRPSGA